MHGCGRLPATDAAGQLVRDRYAFAARQDECQASLLPDLAGRIRGACRRSPLTSRRRRQGGPDPMSHASGCSRRVICARRLPRHSPFRAAPVSAEAAGFALPPANGGYDSQLGGAYPPAAGVTVVSRDREEAPAAGLYSICYVNAFQTQAHEAGWWKQNHDRLLLRTASGSLCRGRQLAGRDPARHVERGEARRDPGDRRPVDRQMRRRRVPGGRARQSRQLDPLGRQAHSLPTIC